MVEKKSKVNLKTGLHARPAALFVQQASKFASDIKLIKEDIDVNAKSIMGIMAMALSKGSEVTICAEGPDEKEAVEALIELLEKETI
ncbi:HPr family phosphocarrier protein [Proteinivorax hydrogeniformans]|uniref:Phosphocarrier protein HPr n=1 Tax=Proteinivorax hydrogeniformans TaxID=1826727 RepID=A0AAU8HV48_9FIRM